MCDFPKCRCGGHMVPLSDIKYNSYGKPNYSVKIFAKWKCVICGSEVE